MEVDHTTHKGLLRFPHKQCLVYTDGSLLTDKNPDSTSNDDEEPASAGSCIIIPGPTPESPLYQALYTFGGVQDVPKAEMIAITKAPAHLPNLPDDTPTGEGYHIFSDSLSSLLNIIRFINNPTCMIGHRFFARLQELILTVNSRPNKEHFHFYFVRSHVGITGNEQADEGARKAAQTKYTPRSAEQQPNEDHHTKTQESNLFDSLHHLKGTDPLPGGATISIQWPTPNLPPSTHPPEEESKRKTRKILYHLILGLKTHMRSRLHPWTWIHLRDRAKDRWLPLYGSGYTDPFPREPILHPMSGTLPWFNLSDAKLQILLKCSTGTFFSNSSIHKGPDSHCPLCRGFTYAEPWHHTDGWTHTSRLCRHPTLENMRIKLHNDCVRMVTDAIQYGTYGGCYHFAAVPGHTVKDQRDHKRDPSDYPHPSTEPDADLDRLTLTEEQMRDSDTDDPSPPTPIPSPHTSSPHHTPAPTTNPYPTDHELGPKDPPWPPAMLQSRLLHHTFTFPPDELCEGSLISTQAIHHLEFFNQTHYACFSSKHTVRTEDTSEADTNTPPDTPTDTDAETDTEADTNTDIDTVPYHTVHHRRTWESICRWKDPVTTTHPSLTVPHWILPDVRVSPDGLIFNSQQTANGNPYSEPTPGTSHGDIILWDIKIASETHGNLEKVTKTTKASYDDLLQQIQANSKWTALPSTDTQQHTLDHLNSRPRGTLPIVIGARGAIPYETITNLTHLGLSKPQAKDLAVELSITASRGLCSMIATRRALETTDKYIKLSCMNQIGHHRMKADPPTAQPNGGKGGKKEGGSSTRRRRPGRHR